MMDPVPSQGRALRGRISSYAIKFTATRPKDQAIAGMDAIYHVPTIRQSIACQTIRFSMALNALCACALCACVGAYARTWVGLFRAASNYIYNHLTPSDPKIDFFVYT